MTYSDRQTDEREAHNLREKTEKKKMEFFREMMTLLK